MREIGGHASMARKVLRELPGADVELMKSEIARALREWKILATLQDDLIDPHQTATLWEAREAIEHLVGDGETYINEEIEGTFPPITDAYKQQLTQCVRGEA